MPSPSSNTSRWKELSEIDYFSLFIKTWLAFNSWYRGHYPGIRDDRGCLEELKKYQDTRNSFFLKFSKLLNSSDRDSASFKDSLEGFVVSLNRTIIQDPANRYQGRIYFENSLTDVGVPTYENLIKPLRSRNSRKFSTIAIDNRDEKVFVALIEIIYQMRCLLLHGQLEPTNENHEIIKYAYLLLSSLIKDL